MATPREEVQRRYVRPPAPLEFPSEADVPETGRHRELRGRVFESLRLAFCDVATVSSDQFVYWDPTDPSACLAPDAFVRMGASDALFDSWKAWERGAPHVAVEIVSSSDASEERWEEKLGRYRRLGVQEVVRFDPAVARPLRVWDHVAGDLVERELAEGAGFCGPLQAWWVTVEEPGLGLTLRLARDAAGRELLPTTAEQAREAEARAEAEGAARERAEVERDAALVRVRALEDALRRR